MALKNCEQCGKVYIDHGGRLCRECLEVLDDYFFKVKEYINHYPNADIKMIAHNTGVKEKIILQFLREGKLITNGEGLKLTCSKCGAPIQKGKFCVACISLLEKELKKGMEKNVSSTNANSGKRMYTIDHIKRNS